MTPTTVGRIALAAALAISIPTAAAAQADGDTPEGTTWHLSSYAVDGAMEPVPWLVDATLLLEDDTASGSGGCNTFSGGYTLVGGALTFDEAFAVTQAACPEPQMRIEDAYLPLLPAVASWSISDEVLTLTDAESEPLLVYEQPVVALTASDLAAIAAQLDVQQGEIERASDRIDNIRIGALRDRIKELESAVASIRSQVAESSPSGSGSGSGSAFNAKEKVLLKAIPRKVEKTCRPLRSGLPPGTVAAVACEGVRKAVAEMAYYLMEWDDAEATLRSVAAANGVPNRNPECFRQRPGWISNGTQIGAEACFVRNGKGNYRLITRASGCRQLNVAGTKMQEPAIYLAIEGKDRKLEPLRAAGLAYTDASYYLMNFEVGEPIPSGNQPRTPTCRTIVDQAL